MGHVNAALESLQAHVLLPDPNWHYSAVVPKTDAGVDGLVQAIVRCLLGGVPQSKNLEEGDLDRFDKVIKQVKNCSNDTLMQAFREGVNEKNLLWAITYDAPPTFAHLRGIAQKYAEAEEYIYGRNSAIGEMWRPAAKNKPKKDRAGQTGVAIEKTTCKDKAASEPKTPT
ncbi:hypothetical protein TIFTF001_017826 [Ficus carica]|uniref:Uncharacterized protein n=1 Tax=Ficus carica TaxID=3494 RepID=A0AA88A325_FICCA|nr:hypothetical protein TIFTF001_017826 [Ficus carica]